MRRTAIASVLLLFGGCRCERNEPATALPPGDASVCSIKQPARGARHVTPSGRTFHVWTPSNYDGTRSYPLLFAVHGWRSNGRDFQKWFKMESFTDDQAIVVYPDAKDIWDLDGTADLEFFDAMLDGMTNAYCIDRARVFAIGFSYGGKMVHHLGCKRAERFKGISVGDGSWVDGAPQCGRLPVFVTHRTRDDDELIEWGRDAARKWARVNGCSDETDTTDPAHGCVTWRGCTAPGSITFCEDTYFNDSWPHDWNHTIREEYLRLTWRWFASLP